MKTVITLFTIAAASLFLGCDQSSVDKTQMVNPVLGDISFESKFGHKPNSTTDKHLRIKTHLEYVENLLRDRDVSFLSAELQTKRTHLLDLLHNYWENGKFPKNFDYTAVRKPCFIDKEGTICAVGYLVEQTTNRQVAEKINKKYKYEDLLAMNDPMIDHWVLTSGLTKEECAMIQPTYDPIYYNEPSPPSNNHITPGYGISSSIIGGLNLSLNTVNAIQIGKTTTSKAVPIVGLITGAGQIALGSAMFSAQKVTDYGTFTNESQRTLSMVNIGLGTSTMILSVWNLIINSKPKEKLTSWNIYSYPTPDHKRGIAFSFTRKF